MTCLDIIASDGGSSKKITNTEFNWTKARHGSSFPHKRTPSKARTCMRGVSKWVLFGHALIRLSPGAFSEREDGDRRCAPLRAPGGRGAHALRGMQWGWCRGWRGCRRGSAGDPLGHSRHAGQDTPQVSRSSDGAPQETQRRPHQDLQAHQRGKNSAVTTYLPGKLGLPSRRNSPFLHFFANNSFLKTCIKFFTFYAYIYNYIYIYVYMSYIINDCQEFYDML